MLVKASKLEIIKKISIKPIKQVEMFTKWLPLIVGKPGAETLCPLPSDDIMKGVKDDKSANAGQKRAAKRKINEVTKALGMEDVTAAQESAITVVEPLAIEQEAEHNNASVALSLDKSNVSTDTVVVPNKYDEETD